jgi:hypothetical protein
MLCQEDSPQQKPDLRRMFNASRHVAMARLAGIGGYLPTICLRASSFAELGLGLRDAAEEYVDGAMLNFDRYTRSEQPIHE